jgi:hypothetical protein
MRRFIGLFASTSLVAVQLLAAVPVIAAPGSGSAGTRYAAQNAKANTSGRSVKPAYSKADARAAKAKYAKPEGRPAKPAYAKPAGRPDKPSYAKPGKRPDLTSNDGYQAAKIARPDKDRPNYNRPDKERPNYSRPVNNRPNYDRPGNNKPGKPNRPRPGGNDINVNINNRYPVYRPPGGGYYRPPGGGFYGPPRPPYGGWRGGYYPPARYYYNDGPSVGEVLFGVAVTTSLLALLSAASQPDVVYVQGQTPPPLPPYVPPSNISGAPASINVDISSMTSSSRASASVCLTEAARQIGATGGREIRIDRIDNVEQGNGSYRFRLTLQADYQTETRIIPMYCRATSDKIVELSFG